MTRFSEPHNNAAVQAALDALEKEHEIRIVAAVESGSRAWGFHSNDSDFDVRFIYCRYPEDYLSIGYSKELEVIEHMAPGKLDLAGWDIRKAFKLAACSNPSIAEWAQSPIVYRGYRFLTRLETLINRFYSVDTAIRAYHSMARGNYVKYVKGRDPVSYKRYLYVLRPLLVTDWIRRNNRVPPVEFNKVSVTSDLALNQEICKLLRLKQGGGEMGEGPRLPAADRYIERAIANPPGPRPVFERNSESVEHYDGLMMATFLSTTKPQR
jgi:predicted nucleotidyltransferase